MCGMCSLFLYFYVCVYANAVSDRLVVAKMVYTHVAKCKEIPFLQYALPIIIPESNFFGIAAELQRTLKLNLNMECLFMTEDKRKHSMEAELPGNVTTHNNKIEMIRLFIDRYLKVGKICLYHDFVVTISEGEEMTQVIDVKKELIRQINDFARIKKIKTGSDGSPQCSFMYNGKTKGLNDDLVMALLMSVLMHKWFMEKEKYRGARSTK